jgi:putative transposase
MKESLWGDLYRLLRSGFRDPLWDDSVAHRVHPGQELSAVGLRRFQRRAEEVSLLIREAFLRGISTRQVGRVVATISGETVSAQTVSKLTRDLDEAVRQFHQAPLNDDYVYLFLDGVNLRVRRPTGRPPAPAGFPAQPGRGPGRLGGAAPGSLPARTARTIPGSILTDGCAGLGAAIRIVYPRVRHQRCWVHKMRNILEKARRRDYDEVKAGAQAIYRAESRRQAEAAFRACRGRWYRAYPAVVRRLQRDLPELLSFFAFPRHLWRKLRTTNACVNRLKFFILTTAAGSNIRIALGHHSMRCCPRREAVGLALRTSPFF